MILTKEQVEGVKHLKPQNLYVGPTVWDLCVSHETLRSHLDIAMGALKDECYCGVDEEDGFVACDICQTLAQLEKVLGKGETK